MPAMYFKIPMPAMYFKNDVIEDLSTSPRDQTTSQIDQLSESAHTEVSIAGISKNVKSAIIVSASLGVTAAV